VYSGFRPGEKYIKALAFRALQHFKKAVYYRPGEKGVAVAAYNKTIGEGHETIRKMRNKHANGAGD